MTIRLSLEGGEALQRALREMSDEVRVKVGEAVQATAAELEAAVKIKMQQGPHTGRIYRRGNVVHQASAPGQPPAPDTGALMQSVYHEMDGPLSAVAGSRLVYSQYLEFGTSRMAARPVWRPAVEDMGKVFTNRVIAALEEAAK